VQVLLAVRELLLQGAPSEVKMYPQLFWGVLALLQTVHVPVFALVLDVLSALLARLELWNLPTQQILQAGACAPSDAVLPTGTPAHHSCPSCPPLHPHIPPLQLTRSSPLVRPHTGNTNCLPTPPAAPVVSCQLSSYV
jgi:hypothetical protein